MYHDQKQITLRLLETVLILIDPFGIPSPLLLKPHYATLVVCISYKAPPTGLEKKMFTIVRKLYIFLYHPILYLLTLLLR